jgi:U2-associated protein SR140
MSAKAVEERVLSVLEIWREWCLFSPIFVYGLEATFLRTASDSESFLRQPEESKEITPDELEAIKRKARQAGVTLTPTGTIGPLGGKKEEEKGYDYTLLEQFVQLERKINHATDYYNSKQVVSTFIYDDVDGIAYDPDDIDGVPYDPDDIDGVPYNDDDIDGVPYNDDIDGVPYNEDDDIDGVPYNDTAAAAAADADDDIDGVQFQD